MRRQLQPHRLPTFEWLDDATTATYLVDRSAAPDWTDCLRRIERARRKLESEDGYAFPSIYLAHETFVSFRLDGISVARQDVTDALARTSLNRSMRSRLTQRIRNHVSILRQLEHALHVHAPLAPSQVLRWYTSISCGLCATGLNDVTTERLDRVIQRINSPQLRLRPAVEEIATLHTTLMTDPLVPSFNGILVRLLLRYHLGRCNLPPVFFDPAMDPSVLHEASQFLPRLLQLIERSFMQLIEHG